MASIESIKMAIIEQLSERPELSNADIVNYERQFVDNLRMRNTSGLLTTDISDYEQHQLYAYAEELGDGEWITVIRQCGYAQHRELYR